MNLKPASEPSSSERNLTRLVEQVFLAWDNAGVPFLVLRNYEHLPETVSNDIDVLVPPAQTALAERELIRAALECGFRLHNRVQFVPLSLCFHNRKTREQIQFDLFSSLKWRAFPVLPVKEVLEQRVPQNGFSKPHPAHEAVLNLLTRLLFKGHVKESYKPGVLAGATEHEKLFDETLKHLFGTSKGSMLAHLVREGRWQEIEDQAPLLRSNLARRQVFSRPFGTLKHLAADISRLAGRFITPPGLSIAFLGPDGSGKSTVEKMVAQKLRHTFPPDKGLVIHWKPVIFFRRRRDERPPTTDPHQLPPRGTALSHAFLIYHWIEFFVGAFSQIRPATFRNGLVTIDRYYYDFMVDPKRYRLNPASWFARLGLALLPKPDLVFLLDAPPDVLQARKAEVPIEETRRQREAYRNLVRTLPNGRVVDATPTAEVVADRIVEQILDHLHGRCGKPSRTARA